MKISNTILLSSSILIGSATAAKSTQRLRTKKVYKSNTNITPNNNNEKTKRQLNGYRKLQNLFSDGTIPDLGSIPIVSLSFSLDLINGEIGIPPALPPPAEEEEGEDSLFGSTVTVGKDEDVLCCAGPNCPPDVTPCADAIEDNNSNMDTESELCCAPLTKDCPPDLPPCDVLSAVPMPEPMPEMKPIGGDYCVWGPDYECYESGWPSCCESKDCPEERPDCEIEGGGMSMSMPITTLPAEEEEECVEDGGAVTMDMYAEGIEGSDLLDILASKCCIMTLSESSCMSSISMGEDGVELPSSGSCDGICGVPAEEPEVLPTVISTVEDGTTTTTMPAVEEEEEDEVDEEFDPFMGLGNSMSMSLPEVEETPEPTDSIYDIASSSDDFSTLTSAIDAAGLTDVLSGDGALTVFAPNNEAFADLSDELRTKLFDPIWQPQLQDVLLYHVLGEVVPGSDVLPGESKTTLNGEDIEFTYFPPGVNGNKFLMEEGLVDIAATNGVIHAIDGVLEPTSVSSNIVDIASANDDFSTLVQAIAAAGLVGPLSGEGPLTVFAPTNEAFAKLPEGTLDYLLLPENVEELQNILTYHIVPSNAASSSLSPGDVDTLNGASIAVDTPAGAVMINNATVTKADIIASNGIIHVVDKVLIPPPSDDTPSPSAAGTTDTLPLPPKTPAPSPSVTPPQIPTSSEFTSRPSLPPLTLKPGWWRTPEPTETPQVDGAQGGSNSAYSAGVSMAVLIATLGLIVV